MWNLRHDAGNARIPDEVKELTIQVKDAYEAADKISSRVKEPYKPVSFSLENMAAKTIDVYKEVLKSTDPLIISEWVILSSRHNPRGVEN